MTQLFAEGSVHNPMGHSAEFAAPVTTREADTPRQWVPSRAWCWFRFGPAWAQSGRLMRRRLLFPGGHVRGSPPPSFVLRPMRSRSTCARAIKNGRVSFTSSPRRTCHLAALLSRPSARACSTRLAR